MLLSLESKIAAAAVSVLLFVFTLGLAHHMGVSAGQKHVQSKWDQAVAVQTKQIAVLQGQLNAREYLHRQETVRITDQLHKAENDHETAIAVLRSDTAHRLLDSERRAATYRANAEAGTGACRDLAGRTAQFDRALEEGRSLVVEFGSTLRLRDNQLRSLGAVIAADHKLLDTK